jgi:hypothetical protein
LVIAVDSWVNKDFFFDMRLSTSSDRQSADELIATHAQENLTLAKKVV